ncbi:hypothetical protein CRG98_013836 [Punica granatum]|uniref:Uncharacterized protein n=1 Tax=Punica granatum TaxID=22663 RepID=A0A2I0KB63_PUNGR|nr:hypothetical protein CRG98_013836 [Punica granatum]
MGLSGAQSPIRTRNTAEVHGPNLPSAQAAGLESSTLRRGLSSIHHRSRPLEERKKSRDAAEEISSRTTLRDGRLRLLLPHGRRFPLSESSPREVSSACIDLDSGRRRSRAGLLRVYLVASSVSIVVSVACVFKSNLTFEDIQNAQNWEAKKLELLQGSRVFLGSVLQVVVIKTVISLIHNMSPPKRAS